MAAKKPYREKASFGSVHFVFSQDEVDENLIHAAQKNDVEGLLEWLGQGADSSYRSYICGKTALEIAVEKEFAPIVKILLDANAKAAALDIARQWEQAGKREQAMALRAWNEPEQQKWSVSPPSP